MPCRSLLPAAPTSLTHLWITDDLLTEAFSRFLRVSHASRRYGSNVPGPLEARRRLAKRKMGMAAVGMPAGGYDVGALFGAGARPPPPPPTGFERGWRWEAPLPVSSGSGDGGNTLSNVGLEERTKAFWEVPKDSPETSKKAFEELLDARQDKKSLHQEDVEPLLDFLQSSANDPNARLTLRLVQWLERRSRRSLSRKCEQSVGAAIAQKITLRTLSEDEEVAVIMGLLESRGAGKIAVALINALPPEWARLVVSRTTKTILERDKSGIENWLDFLRRTPALASTEDAAWTAVYDQLAPHFRPEDLMSHFRSLEGEAFARILLQHWVPRISTDDPSKPIDWPSVQRKFSTKSKFSHPSSPFIRLVALLRHRNVPLTSTVDSIVAFWRAIESIESLHDHLTKLRRRHLADTISISIPLATALINDFLRTPGFSHAARRIFQWCKDIEIQSCPDLPLQMIQEGTYSGEAIWEVLGRTPTAPKDDPPTSLDPAHAHLIHRCAYAWATPSYDLRARVQYRRIWECYHFLRLHSAPRSRLLSRALVRAGVINCVREGRPLSKHRVRHILSVVEEIEGSEVAHRVERMVFDFWIARKRGLKHKTRGALGREWRGLIWEDGKWRFAGWRTEGEWRDVGGMWGVRGWNRDVEVVRLRALGEDVEEEREEEKVQGTLPWDEVDASSSDLSTLSSLPSPTLPPPAEPSANLTPQAPAHSETEGVNDPVDEASREALNSATTDARSTHTQATNLSSEPDASAPLEWDSASALAVELTLAAAADQSFETADVSPVSDGEADGFVSGIPDREDGEDALRSRTEDEREGEMAAASESSDPPSFLDMHRVDRRDRAFEAASPSSVPEADKNVEKQGNDEATTTYVPLSGHAPVVPQVQATPNHLDTNEPEPEKVETIETYASEVFPEPTPADEPYADEAFSWTMNTARHSWRSPRKHRHRGLMMKTLDYPHYAPQTDYRARSDSRKEALSNPMRGSLTRATPTDSSPPTDQADPVSPPIRLYDTRVRYI